VSPLLNIYLFQKRKLENPKLLKGSLKVFPFEFDLYFNSSFELIKLNFRFYLEYPQKKIFIPHPFLESFFIKFFYELKEFFHGKKAFLDLPHRLGLKPASIKVLKLLREIPKGQIITYAELAKKTGLPKGQRAVARILALNPLPLIYPCHRVISQRGLSGFSQGILLKWFLLYWEYLYQNSDRKIFKSKL